MICHVKEGHECKLLLCVVAGAGIGLAVSMSFLVSVGISFLVSVGLSFLVSVGMSYRVSMHLKNSRFVRALCAQRACMTGCEASPCEASPDH